MESIKQSDLQNITPEQLVEYLNKGSKLVEVTMPFIKEAFTKVNEFFKSIQTDKLSTPHGKRVHIEALEARNILQKELNKTYDAFIAAHS